MDPIAFGVGPFTVPWYGLMIFTASVLGEILLLWLAWREGIPLHKILVWLIFLIIGGMSGAKLASAILHPLMSGRCIQFHDHQGMVSYGALVGVLAAGWAFSRLQDVSLWKLLDIAMPPVALGFALSRVGCFLGGCCYGRPTDLPWGVTFPPFSPAWMEFGDAPVHPAQLYAVAGNLLLLLVLLALRRRKPFDGFLFLSWMGLYAGLRFTLEYFRADPRVALGMTAAQLANLVIGPAALALLWIKMKEHIPTGNGL